MRATWRARNPNLQVVNYAWVAWVWPAFISTSTKNEWNVQNAGWSHVFQPSTPRYLIMCVLTICHDKPAQSTHCIVAKAFDLRSLSPTLHNLWLLLENIIIIIIIIIPTMKTINHNDNNDIVYKYIVKQFNIPS